MNEAGLAWEGMGEYVRVVHRTISIPEAVRAELVGVPETATIAVGLSGGVDSTMTATLLHAAGYRVVGLMMSIWDGSIPLSESVTGGCFGPGEVHERAKVEVLCRQLEIPLHVVPLSDRYRDEVLDYVRSEYRAGRTPNPCVRCNYRMKLGHLLASARESVIQFDLFATGHYARRRWDPERRRYRLFRAVDRMKDQSYFLSNLRSTQLASLVLPLGSVTKSDVKRWAEEIGLGAFARQRESQDFLDGRDYSVLFDPSEARPGPIVDLTGRVLGEHRGLMYYTVGQRKGLGIGGAGEPWYVVRIEPELNRLVVGRRSDATRRWLRATSANWVAWERPPSSKFRAACQIRQRHEPAPATVYVDGGDSFRVEFDEPQFAIAPGQVAVLYEGDEVLGAGIIEGSYDLARHVPVEAP